MPYLVVFTSMQVAWQVTAILFWKCINQRTYSSNLRSFDGIRAYSLLFLYLVSEFPFWEICQFSPLRRWPGKLLPFFSENISTREHTVQIWACFTVFGRIPCRFVFFSNRGKMLTKLFSPYFCSIFVRWGRGREGGCAIMEERRCRELKNIGEEEWKIKEMVGYK